MLPRSRVWYPTLVLANSYSKLEELGADWLSVQVFSNGLVVYIPGDIFTVSCTADVNHYPFDHQTCNLNFVAWGYDNTVIRLHLHSSKVLKTYFSENGEWVYEKADAYSIALAGQEGPGIDVVGYTIYMKRRSGYLIFNVILPLVFTSLINLLVFFLPVESGERVSFSVTVMLSLAVFLTIVEDNLPKTSDPLPKLSYYLIFSLISSVCVCLVNVFSLRVFFNRGGKKVSSFFKLLVTLARTRSPDKFEDATKETRKYMKTISSSNVLPTIHSDDLIKDENKINTNETKQTTSEREDCGKDDITWIDASKAIDRLALSFFFLIFLINNGYLATVALT
ncbi:hypothetical protein ACF0H5_002677 [Mactra antiquata]